MQEYKRNSDFSNSTEFMSEELNCITNLMSTTWNAIIKVNANKVLDSVGNEVDGNGYYTSDFIDVNEYSKLSITESYVVCLYTQNKKFIKRIVAEKDKTGKYNEILIDNELSCYFIRVSYEAGFKGNVKVWLNDFGYRSWFDALNVEFEEKCIPAHAVDLILGKDGIISVGKDNCDFTIIKEAIENNPENYIIQIFPGKYTEQLSLDKQNLFVEGFEKERVIIETDENIHVSSAHIKNLTINNKLIYNGGELLVENCELKDIIVNSTHSTNKVTFVDCNMGNVDLGNITQSADISFINCNIGSVTLKSFTGSKFKFKKCKITQVNISAISESNIVFQESEFSTNTPIILQTNLNTDSSTVILNIENCNFNCDNFVEILYSIQSTVDKVILSLNRSMINSFNSLVKFTCKDSISYQPDTKKYCGVVLSNNIFANNRSDFDDYFRHVN